jgi:protein-disulfide isomerase
VLAANGALVARAGLRQATLLGGSAPPPAAPAAPAAPEGPEAPPAVPSTSATAGADAHGTASPVPAELDAKAWRERAQALQSTLDDPQKLEAYFAEKAQREFEASAPVSIDTSGIPPKGPATAPVKVVEFSDFLCPFCRNLGLALSQFVPQAGGRVAVYFKNYPLDSDCNPKLPRATHPGACNLALGAVCARNQGKFDAYHDRVFQSELRNPQPADVVRIAGEAGLNAAAMEGCLGDPQTRRTLEAEIAEGNRLEVNATPTVFVNGRKLPRLNDFVAVVDKEARKQGFPPLGQ